ncbi:MAG: hypothetical protein RTV72_04090 [Candidatus Thorarchaeota archaeon]
MGSQESSELVRIRNISDIVGEYLMRETESLHNEFLKFEDDLDLFSKRIAGVLFWERIRTRIYFQIYFRSLETKVELIPSYSLLHRMRFYLSSFLNIVRNPYFTRQKDVLLIGHPRRLLGSDKKWWDIYTDTFIDYLDVSHVAIEASYYLEHRSPTRTPHIRYFDFLDLIARLRSMLGFSKIRFISNERKMIAEIEKSLLDRFNIKVNVNHIALMTLKIRASKLPLYIQLLKRIKPKLILLVNSLGKETLIEAGKILKIPTAELQHGVINNFHPTYAFNNGKRKYTFPDYMLVWGDYWKENIDYPIPQDNIVNIGFPFIDRELSKCKHIQKKTQILFISQGYVGDGISQLALSLSQELESDFTIAYKLHPSECDTWKEIYPWLVDSKVDVIDRKDTSLHQLFSESIAQVGVGSTAVFEGLAHGLITYILNVSGAEYFDDLAKRGYVTMISSAEDFLNHFGKRTDDAQFDTKFFFNPNASKRILQFIHTQVDH